MSSRGSSRLQCCGRKLWANNNVNYSTYCSMASLPNVCMCRGKEILLLSVISTRSLNHSDYNNEQTTFSTKNCSLFRLTPIYCTYDVCAERNVNLLGRGYQPPTVLAYPQRLISSIYIYINHSILQSHKLELTYPARILCNL